MAEICDNAKKGREYALLGNYDSSMVYYQGVIQQIQRHCQSIRDPAVKGRWQQVRALGSVRGGGDSGLLHWREVSWKITLRFCE